VASEGPRQRNRMNARRPRKRGKPQWLLAFLQQLFHATPQPDWLAGIGALVHGRIASPRGNAREGTELPAGAFHIQQTAHVQ